MRLVLILAALALAAYLAARQFDWLSPHAAGPARQDAAAVAQTRPGATSGVVADVRSAGSDQGPALFLDLGRPHPIESMQVVIPQGDLGKFSPSPAAWEGKRICVTGPVRTLRGRPEIVARGPGQIHVSANR